MGWLLVCFSASAVGAFASIQEKSFYADLSQPKWTPPAWVFGHFDCRYELQIRILDIREPANYAQ
jgi:hypothetical protein